MPNDPYSNFIPMQAYMAANPNAGAEEDRTAGAYEAKHGQESGYSDTGDSPFQRMQHGMQGYTQGENALDASLYGVGHRPDAPAAADIGKNKKKEPKDPDNPVPVTDTGVPAGKGAPRGKFPPGGTGAADDRSNLYDNSANFNPMMAQMKMAQMGMGGGY